MAKKRKSGNMTDQSNTNAADAVAAAALASLGGVTQAASTTLATESSTLHSIAAAAQQTAQQKAEQQAMAEVATAAAIRPDEDSDDSETDIEAEEASEPSDYDIGLEKVNTYIDNYFPEMVGQEPNIRWGHFCINFPGMIGHAGKVADYTLIPHEYRERFEEELAAI